MTQEELAISQLQKVEQDILIAWQNSYPTLSDEAKEFALAKVRDVVQRYPLHFVSESGINRQELEAQLNGATQEAIKKFPLVSVHYEAADLDSPDLNDYIRERKQDTLKKQFAGPHADYGQTAVHDSDVKPQVTVSKG